MKSEAFDIAIQLWRDTTQNKSAQTDYSESELIHQKIGLFDVGNFFYSVFSPNTLEVEFCSPSIFNCLGYEPHEMNVRFFWSCIHPEDLKGILEFEKEKDLFYKSLSPDKTRKYKIRYSFRLKTANGSFTHFLYQSMPFEIDEKGAVLRVIAAFTDIQHLKKDYKMNLSYIGVEGEPDFLNIKEYLSVKTEVNPFSLRELEVLRLISSQFSNIEIADQLNISSITVSNHRKKMLLKTKAGNTLSLVLQARDNGWI